MIMADVQQPNEALDAEEIEGLRDAATHERAQGSPELAALMEHFAEHGLPRVEDCTPWEQVRDAQYRRLGILTDGPRVA
jgi:hypothetical protein